HAKMVADFLGRNEVHFAPDFSKPTGDKVDKPIRQVFIEARRLHGNHLLQETDGFRNLLDKRWQKVLHDAQLLFTPHNTAPSIVYNPRFMKLAILGTRGIPANYGGFETFAEELATRLVARGHDVTVYGRSNNIKYPENVYQGVRLVVLPTIGTKHLD